MFILKEGRGVCLELGNGLDCFLLILLDFT